MSGPLPIGPEGGWALALVRGLSVAVLLSAFGALLFHSVVLPQVMAGGKAARAVLWLAGACLLAAVALLLAWAVLQLAELAQTGLRWRAFSATVPSVIGDTLFGRVWLAQVAAVLAALVAVGRAPRVALALCAIAVAVQAGHGHALTMYGGASVLLAADVVHLLAAGAWLGGLLPLLLAVRTSSPREGALAARRFSPLGKASVAAMAITAAVQGWQLIGTLPGLVGTAYGEMAVVKLVMFGALLAFALANRYRLAPALVRTEPESARRRLVASIGVQTGIGLFTILAAGVLGTLAPALHEDPVWPFASQPSLAAVDGDPELRHAVVVALLELSGAALVVAATLLLRRLRRLAMVAATVVAFVAVPGLRPLFVPAYPTSFLRSPTDFAATSIVHGAALFARHCAGCHGVGGHGDGPVAASLAVPPADLTQAHLWAHPDGSMFWWLSHGIEAPDGSQVMPGFEGTLSADDRWTLIDYVRANNAGAVRRLMGAWPMPVAAPDLVANCPGRHTAVLTSLRGRAVRLVFPGRPLPAAALDDPELVTITVGRDPTGCSAADPAVPHAYATVLGTTPAALAGSDVLIDPNGWLRSQWRDDTAPAVLAALVREICTYPLASASAGPRHEH